MTFLACSSIKLSWWLWRAFAQQKNAEENNSCPSWCSSAGRL